MSTRSKNRKNNFQEGSENVSETIISPVLVGNLDLSDQEVIAAGPSSAKSPRIEKSVLKRLLRASLKEEITSEIRELLAESQRDLLKLLKRKSSETVGEQEKNALENKPREF